jgi:hypothetical protein
MKQFVLLAVVVIALAVGACSTDSGVTGGAPQRTPTETPGEIHNRFLETVSAHVAKGAPEAEACMAVANEMLTEYDCAQLTLEEVRAHIEYGRHLARTVSEFDMTEVLEGEELAWWDRYSREATILTARPVYESHCQRHGSPKKGGSLDVLLSVAVSSAEYWAAEHDIYLNEEKIPTSILRLCIQICVDALAAAIAAACSGPYGIIIGPIVGGLASWGADYLLFSEVKISTEINALEAVS